MCVHICLCMCVGVDVHMYAYVYVSMHVCVCVCVCGETTMVTHNLPFNRGESVTVQAGKVTASAWMDRKTVMVMSTNCQPSSCGTVNRKQRDGTSVEVPCPDSIISYNKFMGGVD